MACGALFYNDISNSSLPRTFGLHCSIYITLMIRRIIFLIQPPTPGGFETSVFKNTIFPQSANVYFSIQNIYKHQSKNMLARLLLKARSPCSVWRDRPKKGFAMVSKSTTADRPQPGLYDTFSNHVGIFFERISQFHVMLLSMAIFTTSYHHYYLL